MDDKRMTLKEALEMPEGEFQQRLEEQERSEPFENKALEQFVRKPEESNLYDKFISVAHFFLLFLFCVICVCSIISSIKGWMEPYVAVFIVTLSLIGGIVILAIDARKNDEMNNKKYK